MRGRQVVVIGAGMVGLATAWHLRRRGANVTVIEREEPAAGSSWGNAGWLSPALAVPLAEPSILRYGLRTLSDPDSALYVPIPPSPQVLKFFLAFARRCTIDQWHATMAHYIPLNRRALEAFDTMGQAFDGTSAGETHAAPIWAAFRSPADTADLDREFRLIRESGLDLQAEAVSASTLREQFDFLTDEIGAGVRIDGQRHIDAAAYVHALAAAVVDDGVELRTDTEVARVRRRGNHVVCHLRSGEVVAAEDVVIANGAWMPHLARDHGVRTTLIAGRGYSFQVDAGGPVPAPLYLPVQRVACTPVGDRFRIAGTMEFRGVDAAFDHDRIGAIIRSIEPFMSGINFDERTDEWVGSRPVTADSLPLVGPTRTPGVWVAGGHGMWGVTLGPITGELLAEWIDTGTPDPALKALDPLR